MHTCRIHACLLTYKYLVGLLLAHTHTHTHRYLVGLLAQTHEEVVGLDISVDEALRVHELDSTAPSSHTHTFVTNSLRLPNSHTFVTQFACPNTHTRLSQ